MMKNEHEDEIKALPMTIKYTLMGMAAGTMGCLKIPLDANELGKKIFYVYAAGYVAGVDEIVSAVEKYDAIPAEDLLGRFTFFGEDPMRTLIFTIKELLQEDHAKALGSDNN